MTSEQTSPAGPRARRVYDPVDPDDGTRVLVDRLWPRGVSRDAARLDEWLKEVAPSNELRKWYHAGGSYRDFAERYRTELAAAPGADAFAQLRAVTGAGPATLLTAAKSVEGSHVAVLLELLGAPD